MLAKDHIKINKTFSKTGLRYYDLANDLYNPKKNPGNVYIIQLGNTDHFKVGISIDPYERMKQIQAKCPIPLKLIYCRWGHDYAFMEKAIHHRYEKQRVRGEWFRLSVEDIINIVSFFSELAECSYSDNPALLKN